jgi:MtaA/CmuA family methyltransferase
MAYLGVLDDVRRCVALEEPSRVPFFPLGVMYDFHVMGLTHKGWRTDPEAMLRVGTGAIRMFDYDIYMLHPDDLVEYEEMGIQITDEVDLPPAVRGYLPPTEETLAGLQAWCGAGRAAPAGLAKQARLALHLAGLRALKGALGDTVCLTGRIAAPFTTISLILGIEETLLLMLENPALLGRYIDFFLGYNAEVGRLQLEAGADALWLGDCVATSHFISVEQYKEFAAAPAQELSRRVRARGATTFYHGAEVSIPHLEVMADLDFDAINIGYGVDIGDVKKAIGARMCIMGNLDTIRVLRPLPVADVQRDVARILGAAAPGGGYIFCTGEGITHDTPLENTKAMMRAVRDHGSYQGG